jgi:hypothetical protein
MNKFRVVIEGDIVMKRGSIARKKITTTAEFVGSKEEFKTHHIESCLDFTRTDSYSTRI